MSHKAYGKGVEWKNYPDTDTPLTAELLNIMNNGIRELDAGLTAVEEEIKNKADKTSVYTKSEVDAKVNTKANKANTLSGYGITDGYTKTQIDEKYNYLDKYIERNILDIQYLQTRLASVHSTGINADEGGYFDLNINGPGGVCILRFYLSQKIIRLYREGGGVIWEYR